MKTVFRKQFNDLRAESVTRDVPNITEATALYLYSIVRSVRPKRILEVGTANGLSTMVFAEAMRENGLGDIDTIDWSKPTYEEATANFKRYEYTQIHQHFGDARVLIPSMAQVYDVVFIDAMKKDYLNYMQVLRGLVHEESIIIFDDVIKFKYKMEVFYNYLAEHSIDHTVINTDPDDGIMVLYDMSSLGLC